MKKRVMITVLVGAFVVGALFTGCSKSDKVSDVTTATEASTTVATQSATETATEKATEQTTSQNTTETAATENTAVTENPTDSEEPTADTPTEESTQAAEEETPYSRTDGSILTNTEYRDTLWGMTITFPESWQNDNIVVLNNNSSDGRTLSFVEKSNYNADKNLGLIFRLRADTKPMEETNNDKNLGYFIDENGNTMYLSCFTTSDVRTNLEDETLADNYRQVLSQKDDALSSITFDEERDFHSTVE